MCYKSNKNIEIKIRNHYQNIAQNQIIQLLYYQKTHMMPFVPTAA